MKRFEDILLEVESKIPLAASYDPKVSASAVGWHIEHILLSAVRIVEAMLISNPADYNGNFSFKKFVVFTFRKIPRGKAKAPKTVRPAEHITIDTLTAHLIQSQDLVRKLNTLKANHFFDHPVFGHVRLKPAIRFLKIHTQHHLNIIEDILQSAKVAPSNAS